MIQKYIVNDFIGTLREKFDNDRDIPYDDYLQYISSPIENTYF